MILYSNSCSYGVCSTGKTYSDFIGESLGATRIINNGLSGACNTRILRTATRDLLGLIKNKEEILVLIGVAPVFRSEVWDQNFLIGHEPIGGIDGHFRSFQTNYSDIKFMNHNNKEYFKAWVSSFYAVPEFINLCYQLNTFMAFLENNNIKYKIWSGPMNYLREDYDPDFINDPLITSVLSNKNVFNFFDFSFANYCSMVKKYVPYDFKQYGLAGHHTEEAHKDFAEHILGYLKNEI